ncbi:hypothetical protein Tco_0454462 [Tanacetum coccineum]
MFMANLSSADPVSDVADPSYDFVILFEACDHDNYIDNMTKYPEEHKMQNDVQPNDVVYSDTEYTNAQAVQCVTANEQNKAVNVSLTAKLARYMELSEAYEK